MNDTVIEITTKKLVLGNPDRQILLYNFFVVHNLCIYFTLHVWCMVLFCLYCFYFLSLRTFRVVCC